MEVSKLELKSVEWKYKSGTPKRNSPRNFSSYGNLWRPRYMGQALPYIFLWCHRKRFDLFPFLKKQKQTTYHPSLSYRATGNSRSIDMRVSGTNRLELRFLAPYPCMDDFRLRGHNSFTVLLVFSLVVIRALPKYRTPIQEKSRKKNICYDVSGDGYFLCTRLFHSFSFRRGDLHLFRENIFSCVSWSCLSYNTNALFLPPDWEGDR